MWRNTPYRMGLVVNLWVDSQDSQGTSQRGAWKIERQQHNKTTMPPSTTWNIDKGFEFSCLIKSTDSSFSLAFGLPSSSQATQHALYWLHWKDLSRSKERALWQEITLIVSLSKVPLKLNTSLERCPGGQPLYSLTNSLRSIENWIKVLHLISCRLVYNRSLRKTNQKAFPWNNY